MTPRDKSHGAMNFTLVAHTVENQTRLAQKALTQQNHSLIPANEKYLFHLAWLKFLKNWAKK